MGTNNIEDREERDEKMGNTRKKRHAQVGFTAAQYEALRRLRDGDFDRINGMDFTEADTLLEKMAHILAGHDRRHGDRRFPISSAASAVTPAKEVDELMLRVRRVDSEYRALGEEAATAEKRFKEAHAKREETLGELKKIPGWERLYFIGETKAAR